MCECIVATRFRDLAPTIIRVGWGHGKYLFEFSKKMISEAFCFFSEHSRACEELYEVPGGIFMRE
eukprot:9328301-Pyramimonas_sp.AAC.1